MDKKKAERSPPSSTPKGLPRIRFGSVTFDDTGIDDSSSHGDMPDSPIGKSVEPTEFRVSEITADAEPGVDFEDEFKQSFATTDVPLMAQTTTCRPPTLT